MSADPNDCVNHVSEESLSTLSDQAQPNGGPRSKCEVLSWFLILTKSASENVAKTNLARQGYRVYYPRLQRPVLHRGGWIDRIVSLFPRYLFVQLDTATQSLAPVRSTLGVANVVRFGAETAVVPAPVVDGLMRRADPETGLHRLSRGRILEPGCAIRVIAGAFEGLEGIFEREGGDERVIVLLKLLSQDTPVRVSRRFVVPCLAI